MGKMKEVLWFFLLKKEQSYVVCMPVIVGGGRGYKGKLRFGGFPPVLWRRVGVAI